ncbi:MAG: hypothetical protein ACOY3P_02080 [Planctomycetota bacterium]
MKHRYALFDVDCHELNAAGNGLSRRPRVEPLADKLERLYACAVQYNLPVVFTTCCSGRMPRPGDLPDVLFVPLDRAQREWEDHVDDHRLFYLEKKAYGEPRINSEMRAYDMFQDNANAARLAELLGVEEWIVFGNAFDVCTACGARGLLAAGQRVCLLPDVGVLGARGYGESGTEEHLRKVLAELERLGATTGTLDSWLDAVAS